MHCDELKLRRMGAKVRVTGDSSSIAWIRDRGQRYFEFDAGFADEDAWHIISGKETAPALPWKSFERGIPAAPCTYHLNANRGVIVVDAPPGRWRDLWTLRLVRDLLRWQLFRDGAIFVHASLVSHQSAGVALVGKSRSGKSTLLLQLLRTRDFAFVAEDDLTIIRRDSGRIVGLGWPGCLRLRRSMLKFFPELADESGLLHPANEIERNGNPESALLRLFPEEVESRFGCSVKSEASVNYLARLDWAGAPATSPLSVEATAEALVESWDILPERRAGARPDYHGGSTRQWRDCCFNPLLFDFFGLPPGFGEDQVRASATGMTGYAIHHNSDPTPLRRLLGCGDARKG